MKNDISGAYRAPNQHTPERVRARNVKQAGQDAWETNPFWEALTIETRKRRSKLLPDEEQMLVSRKTGEVGGITEMSLIYEVDNEAFVKVYKRFLHVFFDTSKNAQKLFEVVLSEVAKKKEQDEIYLHPKTADRYHKDKPNNQTGKGYSESSFYRAISELIEKGILAKSATGPNLYWINPVIFWNGDRIRFVTEFYKSPEIAGPDEDFR